MAPVPTFAQRPLASAFSYASARPHCVVLDDHARLPWRFFGRLTAGVLAGL